MLPGPRSGPELGSFEQKKPREEVSVLAKTRDELDVLREYTGGRWDEAWRDASPLQRLQLVELESIFLALTLLLERQLPPPPGANGQAPGSKGGPS